MLGMRVLRYVVCSRYVVVSMCVYMWCVCVVCVCDKGQMLLAQTGKIYTANNNLLTHFYATFYDQRFILTTRHKEKIAIQPMCTHLGRVRKFTD